MLEDKLPELIRSTFNIKILTVGTYKAKQTLAAKGLTPAVFLERFYKEKGRGSSQIAYGFKQKNIRPMPDFCPIDYQEYDFCRKDGKDSSEDLEEQKISKKIFQELHNEQIKFHRNIQKQMLSDRLSIQKFLNNQSFHWFDRINKIFFYAAETSQSGFRLSTISQPLGVTYIIEVEKNKNLKEIFQKSKKDAQILLRKLYQLNLHQVKNIKPMAIIIFDMSQGLNIQDALNYSTQLTKQYGFQPAFIYRLPINEEELHDSVQWGHFTRPLLHFKYSLKSSDPIRLLNYQKFAETQEKINLHKDSIRKTMQIRLEQLIKKYEELNKTSNRLMNFFKGSSGPSEKKYVQDEIDLRQLADKLFILEDYKKSYDIYKSLIGKIEGRNPTIQLNLSEMIQYCLAMSKYHNIKLRSDPYGSIEKYSQGIFGRYNEINKIRHIRYLVFMTYVFHTFKTFNRQYIKSVFYSEIKNAFSSNLNVVALLVYEQYANMNLMYPRSIDYRKYSYDLTRVASRFTEVRLHGYALRCLLIVENMYQESFSNIQKYQALQLSHLFIEIKNYKQALVYLKKAWKIYQTRIQNQHSHKDDGELTKLIDNFGKMIRQITKNAPQELQNVVEPNLQIPVLSALNFQVIDEILKYDQKSGTKWQDIGSIFLQNKQLMGRGFSQKVFGNLFRTFDTGIPQQKDLIHRFKSNQLPEAILKKNSRFTYVNQPIRVSFYFRNPLRIQIQIQDVKLFLKNDYDAQIELKRSENKTIQPFQSSKFVFSIIPKSSGFLELEKIQWSFLKMMTQYKIKQPQQTNSQFKSCYFKLNVEQAAGNLHCESYFQQSYYEGEKGEMKIFMKNIGVAPITKVYLAVGDEDIFGFRLQQFDIALEPNQEHYLNQKISIPAINNHIKSGQQKRIAKILILYETINKFRISRTISKFNIIRVARLENFMCQKLSTHLHLLSFTKKQEDLRNEPVDLQWMILSAGYEIVKMQAAELSKETNYFFFLKKGNYSQQKYSFTKDSSIDMYPESILQFESSEQQKYKNLLVKFLWRKNNKYGSLFPNPVQITMNPYSCLTKSLPLNVKVQFQQKIPNNFEKNPCLLVPITLKLKNILQEEKFKVHVYFNESKQSSNLSDIVWEGLTERIVNLSLGEQSKIEISLIVIRAGVFDISSMIKYTIQDSKGHHINVSHNEYEKLYFTVTSNQEKLVEQKLQKNADFGQFDFLLHENSSKQQEQSTTHLDMDSLI